MLKELHGSREDVKQTQIKLLETERQWTARRADQASQQTVFAGRRFYRTTRAETVGEESKPWGTWITESYSILQIRDISLVRPAADGLFPALATKCTSFSEALSASLGVDRRFHFSWVNSDM